MRASANLTRTDFRALKKKVARIDAPFASPFNSSKNAQRVGINTAQQTFFVLLGSY
jgi:DNA uptake protein ComE-like DNA-binding protein